MLGMTSMTDIKIIDVMFSHCCHMKRRCAMSIADKHDWDKQELCASEVQVEHGLHPEQLFCFAVPLIEGVRG